MNNAHAARRRVSLLLSAAAPVALLLALAAPASAQIAAGGGSTAAGTVSNTYNGSGSATVFSGAVDAAAGRLLDRVDDARLVDPHVTGAPQRFLENLLLELVERHSVRYKRSGVRLRPRARRALSTLRPPTVAMRERKP